MFKNLSRTSSAVLFALAAFVTLSAPAARAQNPQSGTPRAATQTPAPSPAPGPSTGLMRTADGHEYAPLLEQRINYKDWTFKSLKDGTPLDLRDALKGKRLVAVVYFAQWCPNWRAEAPVIARLYDKYKASGFDVVAVSEYATADDARKYFDSQGGAPYTVVVESEAREARDQTTHYGYRQTVGDTRHWGSPFNVFLEPARLNKAGDVLTEKAWVVGGELIEKDAEQFIRERLGLSQQSAVEPCKEEPAKAEVKKQ
ncbi:MAG TPA: TlpA disulfide reductase family protein [Pyrinomonadaceae bacterium]|jgi:thiol-disulfide isomerase/thioredoxin|nr:TlpA disulfide reductase family protein [Pyrinomonadaceae bacterium]